MTDTHNIRFGVWAPVHGPRAAFQDPDEPFNASWPHNKAVILEAEALGYDSTLVAQHTVNPRLPDHDQLEAWTASAALAAITKRIEIITAIKPYLYHPVFLAKMALQIENISEGRFAINLVNAWNKAEFEKAGIIFAEHDERYGYGREWIDVVNQLMDGKPVSYKGEHFQLDEYLLTPKSLFRERPLVYLGGESEPGRALAAEHSDVWFINGQPLDDVKALIADLRARPRKRAPLRFGLSAFVIARATEKEAIQQHEHLVELAAKDDEARSKQRANTDSAVVMFQNKATLPRIGSNGGTAAGLVGSYDQVAERMQAFHKAGIELFMLQFQPLVTELRTFAKEIFPRVGKIVPKA